MYLTPLTGEIACYSSGIEPSNQRIRGDLDTIIGFFAHMTREIS